MAGNKKEYKKGNHPMQNDTPENKIETHNRFDILTNKTNLYATEGNQVPHETTNPHLYSYMV